jgi:hypothetical protein
MIEVPARIRRALAFPLLLCLLASPYARAGQADPPTGQFTNYPAPAAGPVLQSATLDEVVRELDLPEPEALNLLDRLVLWLNEYFDDKSDRPLPDWLNDFRLSDVVAQSIFYAACALIVLLAVTILMNEARHLRRSRSRSVPAGEHTIAAEAAPATALDEVSLFERPAYLLRIILGRLSTLGSTNRPLSFTHRDILDLSHGLPPDRRAPLRRLTRVAEQIRYSDAPPSREEVGEAVQLARTLIEDDADE